MSSSGYIRYIVRVFTSEELHGLAGENGERYCCFLRDRLDPLNSGWNWYATEQEAKDRQAALLRELKEASS
mgnify:CR=1 FL=1